MSSAKPLWAALVPYHPVQTDATQQVEARVQAAPGGALIFQYVLRGGLPHVRVPPPAHPDRTDGLWKHTCFEAFIGEQGTAGYYELNFSPSRQWAIYRFDGYRQGMSPVEVTVAPQVSVQPLETRLELEAIVQLPDLAAQRPGRTLKLALTAVVEDDSGRLSYWALRHAPDKPDFHHPEGFVLELTI